jgi:hypothetical protein
MNPADDIFIHANTKYLDVRSELDNLVTQLNRVAADPFQEFSSREPLFNYTPVHWNIEQIYLMLEFLAIRYTYSNFGFIVLDEKAAIQDCFIIEGRLIQIDQNRSQMKFLLRTLPDTPEMRSFIEECGKNIANRVRINERFQKFILEKWNLPINQIILLPYFFQEIFHNLQLPSINTNAFELYNIINDFYNQTGMYEQNPRMHFFIEHFDEKNLMNRTLKNFFSEMENKDIEIWSQIWSVILDELNMNVVVILNNKPTICFKILIEEGKVAINPLPIHTLKAHIGPKIDGNAIAESMYKKTGIRTMVIDEPAIARFLTEYARPRTDYEPFDVLISIFSLIYSAKWYPDSLLNSFLKLFGFELGKDMYKIPEAIQKILQYFEHALFITFFQHPRLKKITGTIVEIGIDQGKSQLKYLENKPFRKFFDQFGNNKLECVKQIKEELEKASNKQYSIVLGFDIAKIADSVSAKNMQAFLGISNMTYQLPFIATLGGLFTSIKALGIEQEQDAIVKIADTNQKSHDKGEDAEKLDLAKFYDEFLKQGIICLLDESKRQMMKIQSPFYSKQGYLGLDLEKMREIIKTRSKKK